MKENKSWIKLYRKLLESPIFENEKALKVWIWCLLKATYTERDQLVGRQIVHLEKGQFVTGRKKASQELKMKERTVYDYFRSLENLKMLVVKTNNKFSVVTITNWEDYQIEELKTNSKINNNATTNGHKQEYKEIYSYFINKYRAENLKRLNEKMKFLRDIKKDNRYKELTEEDEYDLRNYILGDRGD